MANAFSLIKEMKETPAIIKRFNPSQVTPWVNAIDKKNKLLLTGEGSSRIFPAKNMIAKALQRGHGWSIHTEGARQAYEYTLINHIVIGASNSGQTRELINLFEKLRNHKIPCFGMTVTPCSRLTTCTDNCILLTAGKEEATAATKSVIEQALVYQALLQGAEWQHKERAADLCEALLQTQWPQVIIAMVAQSSGLYFAGRNDGVAEELTLKTNEIVRKKCDFLEGTYAVHGIEEVMQEDEIVIVIEPFSEEIEKLQTVLAKGVGIKIIAISSREPPFPTIKIPALDGYDSYFQLIAGWNLLVAVGLSNGIHLDKTIRARKVGNAI